MTFGDTSIPVEWHVISGSCEPVLSGAAALQLGIIKFNDKPKVFQPILMIDKSAAGEGREKVQSILKKYPENFTGLGRLKNYQIKLHVDPEVKPHRAPPRPVPYHLRERATKAIQEMIAQGVIEEQPPDEPAPWVSNNVIAPKDDGGIRITLDARQVNKAIRSTNLPSQGWRTSRPNWLTRNTFQRWISS